MEDELYMARAIALARSAPFTSPNPRVGAVVVRAGEIVGEGAHRGPGTPHAEAAALEGIDAAGATLYVNLEPCAHHGRMPPCAPAVADAGVTRVVAAMVDPDHQVSGRGIEHLRSRGVRVDVGVLEDEARTLNAAFVKHRTTGRPLVTLKMASSIDGRAAAADGSARWITGEAARRIVHERRLEADAVLVGAGTVAADDPELTARGIGAPRQPLRVVFDPSGRVPASARVFSGPGACLVATTDAARHETQTAWKEAGAEVVVLPTGPQGPDLDALLALLGRRDAIEVLCEGGPGLAALLLRADLVDRVELHLGARMVGADGAATVGALGVASIDAAPRFRLLSSRAADDDVIALYERRDRRCSRG